MKLLVSTPLWIFLIDSKTQVVEVVENNRREYYGISWSKEGELALSHSGIAYKNILTFQDYVSAELGGISLGNRLIDKCLVAPHQIFLRQDFVLAANTGRNCLTVFHRSDLFYRHYWFDEKMWDLDASGQRARHFNSVYSTGDRVYLLAHNFEENSFLLMLSWPGLQLIEKIETTARWAHNIWPTNGQILICNTRNGSIDNAYTGEVLWKDSDPEILTRGLACSGEHVFVGRSTAGDRDERDFSPSSIAILNRKSWKLEDTIEFPFAGNIHEVRILDEADECHHGHVYMGHVSPDRDATEEYRAIAASLATNRCP